MLGSWLDVEEIKRFRPSRQFFETHARTIAISVAALALWAAFPILTIPVFGVALRGRKRDRCQRSQPIEKMYQDLGLSEPRGEGVVRLGRDRRDRLSNSAARSPDRIAIRIFRLGAVISAPRSIT
jgi:hypothetical protein